MRGSRRGEWNGRQAQRNLDLPAVDRMGENVYSFT